MLSPASAHRFAETALGSMLLLVTIAAQAVPSFDEVRRAHIPSEAVLLDRNGELLHELRIDAGARRLPWVALPQVSPALVQAVVRAEDRRFWEHAGVDWRALGDAAIDTLVRGTPRGASTLSMQVAGMLEPALRLQGARRTFAQKWDQIGAARDLERAWTKQQILEAYLNLASYRGELHGVAAAARGLFGKDASGLDAREGALLAALLRGPNAAPATVAKRACIVAQAKECSAFDRLAATHLAGTPRIDAAVALAPHLARQLLGPDARRVRTTLDLRIQSVARETLQRQLAQLSARHVQDAAALVLDNATGEVLAYVGNSGAASSAPFVDGVKARRQAGSTLKPFLYATAIEDRLLTAASLLDDSPANLVTPSGLYVPQNYDRDFRGLTSVRTSLSGSLNVPAVRALMLVGTERFVDRLRALGFDGIVEDGDYYGLSLALGSADVTLWQLANAYRTLANGGVSSRPRVLPAPPGVATRVIDAGAAHIVADILSDRSTRSVTFGLENPLATRQWTAVKTGTSKDMRDNWCVGFSRRYTVAVWVGNFDGSPMRDVSGISGAAPAWLDLMNALHRGDPLAPPVSRPADVVAQTVHFVPPIESEREELFLRGTEVAEVSAKPSVVAGARILYPADGAVLALDPDIPADVQRVRFSADTESAGFTWWLDGGPAPIDGAGFWHPVAGRHELVLIDGNGRERDRIRFEVRGSLRVSGP
ncbi:MAG: penicillin-binding protein 1C [Burkholderiales bacterium]|nr:penicillin-binding protein 1C [Burkholderiales bacterium]